MSNCHNNGNDKNIRQSSTDSKCFLRFFWNKKQTENKNQTIIFNVILIYLWLFIVINFFKQTIMTYFFFLIQNYIYIRCVPT